MEKTFLQWLFFLTVVVALLIFDLGYANKGNKTISFKKSLYLSLFYIIIALLYGIGIHKNIGATEAKEYYTGFLIEKALALDNIFVISVIFQYFSIPRHMQHRVLFWGILGVIVFRGIMIYFGANLVQEFAWLLFVFGAFLIITGIKLLINIDKPFSLENNKILKFVEKKFNVVKDLKCESFFVKKDDQWHMTSLFLALMCIEIMDVIFALDSIPAIFAITDNIYIVYTSNIFAILGLRALYFCLENIIQMFFYLKYSLAALLIFIGSKIFYNHFVEKVPAEYSLSATIIILLFGIITSIYKNRPKNI